MIKIKFIFVFDENWKDGEDEWKMILVECKGNGKNKMERGACVYIGMNANKSKPSPHCRHCLYIWNSNCNFLDPHLYTCYYTIIKMIT